MDASVHGGEDKAGGVAEVLMAMDERAGDHDDANYPKGAVSCRILEAYCNKGRLNPNRTKRYSSYSIQKAIGSWPIVSSVGRRA
jgi:hypothetical protein